MNKEEFLQNLRQSEQPTVIDFWAPWCMPCRQTKPVLEQLGKEFEGQVNFQTINADENPNLMQELRIFSIPTVLIMDSNQQTTRIVGAQPPEVYRQIFENLASGQGDLSLPISNFDRVLRLGIGATLAFLAWSNAYWWLLPIGLAVMFWGVYDRCPIWQAISARFKAWQTSR